MTSDNVYRRGAVGDAEAERLVALDVPDRFSRELLGDPSGRDVLDVGAGPNVRLGQWVESQGGHYHVIDPWETAQRAHIDAGHDVIDGADVVSLLGDRRVRDACFDVGHARFLLCHVPADLRARGIAGMLRVCDEGVVIIEHVAEALGGSPGAEQVKAVLRDVDADPDIVFTAFYEDHVLLDAQAAVAGRSYAVAQHRLVRPEGAFHDELVIGAERLLLPVASQRPDLGRRMAAAIETLKKERRDEAATLHMPDLIAVVVSPTEPS